MVCISWWRHEMETFPALLVICMGNSPVPREFPPQRPVTRSFDVFFDLRLNKRLSKQSWGWWFETPSWSLWRQCHFNVISKSSDLFPVRYNDDYGNSVIEFQNMIQPAFVKLKQYLKHIPVLILCYTTFYNFCHFLTPSGTRNVCVQRGHKKKTFPPTHFWA